MSSCMTGCCCPQVDAEQRDPNTIYHPDYAPIFLQFPLVEYERRLNEWEYEADGVTRRSIHVLLSTLHTVLWKESGLKPFELIDATTGDEYTQWFYITRDIRKADITTDPENYRYANPIKVKFASRLHNALHAEFDQLMQKTQKSHQKQTTIQR